AVLVDRVGRRTLQASRATAEAAAMASLAGGLASGAGPERTLTELLGTLRTTFGFRSAALLRRTGGAGAGGGLGGGWIVEAESGLEPPTMPAEADVVYDVG